MTWTKCMLWFMASVDCYVAGGTPAMTSSLMHPPSDMTYAYSSQHMLHSLAEDLPGLHDVFEGDKVLDPPMQPDFAASGGGVRL